jgi:sterol desaturase/sphingolipid hydroxylase (fatty acid hydroxylase superfamily)
VPVILRSRTAAALAGAASWTLVEYALHRGAMHAMRGRGLPSVEHLGHHADVTYFSPASTKIVSAAAATAIVFPPMVAMVGRRRAVAFTVGLITMYFAYEIAHRRTHTHPPRGRYGRWARRNHMHHHFAAPMRNFGVTSSVWDRLLGSYDEPSEVTVPRRMAPKWMIDEAGEVRAEFADDYVVTPAGPLETSQVERDRDDAFANVAPRI